VPPYGSTTAGLGGQPTISLDIPTTAVFLLIFLLGAIAHMTILQLNRRRGHKFFISGALFGFCMARVTTCLMRIVWATRPTNVSVAIAASTFVAVGVIILLIVNLIFAQRVLRAAQPGTGWHPSVGLVFKGLYVLIIITLILIISFVILSFYTLDPSKRNIARDIQLYGGTLNATIAFLPVLLVLLGVTIPRRTLPEKFGTGRYRHKILILLTASFLLSLGAWFRVGTLYLPLRPREVPAWYHSKACFYVFNFGLEAVVCWLYVLVRVDRRFYVADGSKAPAGYLGEKGVQGNGTAEKGTKRDTRIITEGEVLDDAPGGSADVERGTDPFVPLDTKPSVSTLVEKRDTKVETTSKGSADTERGPGPFVPLDAKPSASTLVEKGDTKVETTPKGSADVESGADPFVPVDEMPSTLTLIEQQNTEVERPPESSMRVERRTGFLVLLDEPHSAPTHIEKPGCEGR
jgi:hypothetical protein